jgi:hypothetical protein
MKPADLQIDNYASERFMCDYVVTTQPTETLWFRQLIQYLIDNETGKDPDWYITTSHSIFNTAVTNR